MKKTKWFAAIGAAVALAMCFAGCKTETETHEHTFAEEWTSDAENHWHEATCGHTDEVSGKAAHTFGGWTVTKEPTESEKGSKERTCSVCAYKETESIAPEGFVSVTMADKSKLLVQTTEMTQKMYTDVMGEKPSSFSSNPAGGETQELRPVENVSWYDAIYFCNKKSVADGLTPVYAVNNETDVTQWSYTPHNENSISGTVTQNESADGWRLPTVKEWQYAAKGGENYTYAGSDSIDDVAWYYGNSGRKTHEVKKKNANAYGLYDMSGNVWEWCWDADGSGRRSNCGSSWYHSAGNCGVSSWNNNDAYYRHDDIGFRLVRTASESE